MDEQVLRNLSNFKTIWWKILGNFSMLLSLLTIEVYFLELVFFLAHQGFIYFSILDWGEKIQIMKISLRLFSFIYWFMSATICLFAIRLPSTSSTSSTNNNSCAFSHALFKFNGVQYLFKSKAFSSLLVGSSFLRFCNSLK